LADPKAPAPPASPPPGRATPLSVVPPPEASIREETAQHLAAIRTHLANPIFTTNVEAQTQVVELLQHPRVVMGLGTVELARLHEDVAKAVRMSLPEFHEVLRFPEPYLVKRAFRARLAPAPEVVPNLPSYYPTSGWLHDYLRWSHNEMVPAVWNMWMALATFGAAARRNFYLDRHNHVLYANNYYLFVGPTASGKTTAIETGSQRAPRCSLRSHR